MRCSRRTFPVASKPGDDPEAQECVAKLGREALALGGDADRRPVLLHPAIPLEVTGQQVAERAVVEIGPERGQVLLAGARAAHAAQHLSHDAPAERVFDRAARSVADAAGRHQTGGQVHALWARRDGGELVGHVALGDEQPDEPQPLPVERGLHGQPEMPFGWDDSSLGSLHQAHARLLERSPAIDPPAPHIPASPRCSHEEAATLDEPRDVDVGDRIHWLRRSRRQGQQVPRLDVGRGHDLESSIAAEPHEVVVAGDADRPTIRRAHSPHLLRRTMAGVFGDGTNERPVRVWVDGADEPGRAPGAWGHIVGPVGSGQRLARMQLRIDDRPDRFDAPADPTVWLFAADQHGLVAFEALSGSGGAQEDLVLLAGLEASDQLLDGLWLIAGGLEGSDELEVGHVSMIHGVAPNRTCVHTNSRPKWP